MENDTPVAAPPAKVRRGRKPKNPDPVVKPVAVSADPPFEPNRPDNE